jgi:hypothetical protein
MQQTTTKVDASILGNFPEVGESGGLCSRAVVVEERMLGKCALRKSKHGQQLRIGGWGIDKRKSSLLC